MDCIEKKQIENAINFSNLLESENRVNFQDLFSFLSNFQKKYNTEKINLPYHINLIDELHADENAHSRIFAKLLRYKEKDKYPFLEKFLNNICDFKLNIEEPNVLKVDSCGRIDIPIFDKTYVVVIENKVTDKAPDQNGLKGGQLARYIETIKNSYNRDIEEIFVIYTPKYAREPSDACWKNKDNFSYKDGFKLRFRSLSYRDCIYPWFKNEIRESINSKDLYLRSAIEQYVDHLEGMFSLRQNDKGFNMKLQEFIKKELGISDNNPEEAIEILTEKEIELNNAVSQIQLLKHKYNKHLVLSRFEEWEEKLKKDFSRILVSDKFQEKEEVINVGVKFSIENKEFTAIIECNDCNKPNIYLGIGRHFSSQLKYETPQILQNFLNDRNLIKPEDYWYGWKYTSLTDGYRMLKEIIEEIIELECPNR